MILYILIHNRTGKNRLQKWYMNIPRWQKTALLEETVKVVASRDAPRGSLGHKTNFVEFNEFKLVYRRYAGLFFVMAVTHEENSLGVLEAIHNFVEFLNSFFDNVCELDLVYNFNKVYQIVDIMFEGGEIAETSHVKVQRRLDAIKSMG